jgi:hypothetical protein
VKLEVDLGDGEKLLNGCLVLGVAVFCLYASLRPCDEALGTVYHFATCCRYDLFTLFTPLIESHTIHASTRKV